MSPEPAPQAPPSSPRRPYTAPVLKVFGGITAITGTRDMSGTVKDGGPNNSKT